MDRLCILTLSALVALITPPAHGGSWFKKTPKVDPAVRVPALIMVLKTERDERKREKAAEELKNYDPKLFPEIIPVLIESAQNDPKAAIRMEAADSLAKMRPVNQEVGMVLEQIVDKDNSLRVRLHTRSLLVQYHLSGYRKAKDKPQEGPSLVGIRTDEPPLADPPVMPAQPGLGRPPSARPMPPGPPPSSQREGPDLNNPN